MDDHNDDHTDHGHDVEGLDRITSPMQEFSMSQVGIGLAVFVVGLAVAFAVPLIAA
jgi:hypothetical protein